jgi:hypothetical protein
VVSASPEAGCNLGRALGVGCGTRLQVSSKLTGRIAGKLLSLKSQRLFGLDPAEYAGSCLTTATATQAVALASKRFSNRSRYITVILTVLLQSCAFVG